MAGVVVEAMASARVVALLRPRQAGMSTLARVLAHGPLPAEYLTLDDEPVRSAAQADPEGFVAALGRRTVIDEVQRTPEPLLAIKSRLPGRVDHLTLWPLTQGEIAGGLTRGDGARAGDGPGYGVGAGRGETAPPSPYFDRWAVWRGATTMTHMAVAERMSAEDYMALPEQRFTNLVDGEVVMHDPTHLHQAILFDLAVALRAWTESAPDRGQVSLPIDVALDEHNVYAPDILWYRPHRAPRRSRVRPQPLPDLAVEIRSPSTWRYDIGTKKARYEQHALPELWLVDSDAEVVIAFRRSRPSTATFDVSVELTRTDALTSPLLPGFALRLDELFPPAEDA